MSIDYLVANDIGNSQQKMTINGDAQSQPSVHRRIFQTPTVTETDVDKNIHSLLNNLHVHIASKAIKREGSFLVGKRALQTGQNVESMDISIGKKHTSDLPVINTLSLLAGKAVQDKYRDDKVLPEILKINVTMTTGIPASEYKSEHAKQLEERFKNHKHLVTVYVGEDPVHVEITFDKVKVTQEGVAAVLAIVDAQPDIFEDYNKLYGSAVTGRDFKDKKILHADIGDGTTEYIFTNGLNPVIDACSGERRGLGHAIMDAAKLLSEDTDGYVNLNRQQFSEIIKDNSHKYHDRATNFLYETRYIQAENIRRDIETKYDQKTAGEAEVLAVYGGGSVELKEDLYDELKSFCQTVDMKLLWIPEKNAVTMNRDGMNVFTNKVLNKPVG